MRERPRSFFLEKEWILNLLSIPAVQRHRVSAITTEEMIEVDRLMVEEYGIELVQMMENAGRNLARLAVVRFFENEPAGKKIAVLCGGGGNGGGGLVCARRLSAWGADVQVALTKEAASFTGVPAHQLQILQKMEIPVLQAAELEQKTDFSLIIDAVIGYSLKGSPTRNAAEMIRWANDQEVPVLSLDVPSGIDGSSGAVKEPAINALSTMTLALPKKGLFSESAKKQVGQLYLADISVPPLLYKKAFGFNVSSLFAENEILEMVE